MDRQQAQDYAAAAAMAYAQAQQQPPPPQYGGYHPQAQYPAPPHPYAAPLPQYAPAPSPYARAMPPAYPHLPQHQQPPPHFTAHPPPHVMSTPPHHAYVHPPPPFDSAPPPPAAPPADPELQKRIDKLVEYIGKNGPDFEAMIRDKQHDNPDYAFVFGGEGHAYYRYMLWLSPRPPVAAAPYPHMMPPMGPMMRGPPPMHQPGYPPFYDAHQQFAAAHGHGEYEAAAQPFKGLSGPLPTDVATELHDVLSNLNGTKESIKGAKTWFMQRLPFAHALAEALRERVFALEDSERQLHIIFLVNDILFESLQRRTNIRDLDNEALAFKSVLGSMLARIYSNPQGKDDNQTRVEKILQFWGSKEVYDQETIANLEREMKGGLSYPLAPRHVSPDLSTFSAQVHSKWSSEPPEKDKTIHPVSAPPQSVPLAQFPANHLPAGVYPPVGQTTFPGSLSVQPSLPISVLPQSAAPATTNDSNPPPYPLFPPGLIPGMVRKMQIGSGVPYSPLSPLDIPTVIPPSTAPESEILERVSKFFREIGEVNPSEGPMKQSSEADDYDDYERELPARKGGACIPPPPNLLVNPETGMRADGSVDSKPGSSQRLGLGASADPNEVSQYDDVYSSYRKQRSTTYHSSITARSTSR
ncbi:uncharacterized protein LOC133883151 isoform X2 [Phragmites australis]|uniref:uncharacterized protein LOC133883151 isoform X2 n=1 Tax=Phragmites australis TaxID=29695 RepID=UPI002D76C207|nr:uncharacterized protein LOC133883151 isoform X2 [Phragmites australis]